MLLRIKHPRPLVLSPILLFHRKRIPQLAVRSRLGALPQLALLLKHIERDFGELVPDLVRGEIGRGDVVIAFLDRVDLGSQS